MDVNFFKGFAIFAEAEGYKSQVGKSLNIYPKDVGEDYLNYFTVTNPQFITTDGNKYKIPGLIRFAVKFRGDNIVIIRDASYEDEKHKGFPDFPHGINASPNAGKEYILTKDEYNKLIQPRLPSGEEGGIGGIGGL